MGTILEFNARYLNGNLLIYFQSDKAENQFNTDNETGADAGRIFKIQVKLIMYF